MVIASFISEQVRCCVLPRLETKAIAKADCFCLRPDERLIDGRFLAHQLVTQDTHDRFVGEIHGATRPRINLSQLRAFMLRLPPLAEQKRIVAKVEQLLARVNAARQRLANPGAPGLLKRFRQSVLAAACSGQLTADWRESHPDIEPATFLLQRIADARKHGDGPTQRAPDMAEQDAAPTELPTAWAWCKAHEIAHREPGGNTLPQGARLLGRWHTLDQFWGGRQLPNSHNSRNHKPRWLRGQQRQALSTRHGY